MKKLGIKKIKKIENSELEEIKKVENQKKVGNKNKNKI